VIHLIDPKLHLLYNLLALMKNILFLIEVIPGDPIHVLNILPVHLYLLLQLINPGRDLLDYVFILVLDVVLQLPQLFTQQFYLGLESLRVDT
jgi:hypothetical protein